MGSKCTKIYVHVQGIGCLELQLVKIVQNRPKWFVAAMRAPLEQSLIIILKNNALLDFSNSCFTYSKMVIVFSQAYFAAS